MTAHWVAIPLLLLTACSDQGIQICDKQPESVQYVSPQGTTATITHGPYQETQLTFSFGDDEMMGIATLKYEVSDKGYFNQLFIFIPIDINHLKEWRKESLHCVKYDSTEKSIEFTCRDDHSRSLSTEFVYNERKGIIAWTGVSDKASGVQTRETFYLTSPVGIGAPCLKTL